MVLRQSLLPQLMLQGLSRQEAHMHRPAHPLQQSPNSLLQAVQG